MKSNTPAYAVAVIGILILLGLVMFILITGLPQTPLRAAMLAEDEGGSVEKGVQLIRDYGCGSCHTIPGIPNAQAHVGPPLTHWAERRYIAGSLPNTLENLISWIINPQAIEPGTAMPVLGVSEEEALHISAYLYSLRN